MRRIQGGLCFVLGCAVATGQAARAAELIVSAQDGKFVRVEGRATYPQPATAKLIRKLGTAGTTGRGI